MGLEGFPGLGGGAFQEGVGRKGECEGSWGPPGVESQQLGVYEHKGMQGPLAGPPGAGADGLDDVPLQCLDAQLAELRVDQPLHGLGVRAGGRKPCHPNSSCPSRSPVTPSLGPQ